MTVELVVAKSVFVRQHGRLECFVGIEKDRYRTFVD